MLGKIAHQLKDHAPFTAVGALSGILLMVAVVVFDLPKNVSEILFHILHPMHVAFSALVTTAMYRLHGKGGIWLTVVIGYLGSIGVATLSDAVIPYLGAVLLDVDMHFHVPFLEMEPMPVFAIPSAVLINSLAVLGMLIAFIWPVTKLPHFGHVLTSTWASMFAFTAFGTADWLPLLPAVFAFLFLAVWLPCCVSDIVFPLLWIRSGSAKSGHRHD